MIRKMALRISEGTRLVRAIARQHRELIVIGGLAATLLAALVFTLANARYVDARRRAAPPVPAPISTTNPQRGERSGRPGAGVDPAPTRGPAAPPITHRVAPGETLAGIALLYRVPFEQIAAANGSADHNRIRAGELLLIPPRTPGVVVIEPGEDLTTYAGRYGLSVRGLAALNPQIIDLNRLLAGGSLRIIGGRS